MASPSRVATPAGVQAARTTGMLSESPRAKTTSEKKYRMNPVKTPPVMIKVVPPRLAWRRVKVAAISTMAHIISGAAKSACWYSRCRTAEKPDFSRVLMNSGKSQKDIVSGGAKLS